MPETTFSWQDTSLPPAERALKLVDAMTLEQKIAQLHGAMETMDGRTRTLSVDPLKASSSVTTPFADRS